MSNKYVNLLAFLIVVLVYSLPLYGGMIWSQSYIKKNADKPGLAEIRKIAQENNLKHSEVSNALRPPRKGAAPLIGIMAGQAVLVGFTLLIFGFIRRIISGLSKQKTNGAQQGVPPYSAQGALPGERRRWNLKKYIMGTKGLIVILLSVTLTGCATSRIGGSYSAQSGKPPSDVAKSISDSLKSAGYSAKYRSINSNGSIVLLDNLLVSGIIIIETNEEYETGRIVHLRTDIQLRLFASADRLYKAITAARGVALRNENEFQQAGPAYPPQGVGSADP